jgi:hypothetical protein
VICRVATPERTPDSIASEDAKGFRAWLKEQPGFVGGYHVQDSETGRAISITIWDSEESMMALRDRVPPGGPVGMKPVSVQLFDRIEEF